MTECGCSNKTPVTEQAAGQTQPYRQSAPPPPVHREAMVSIAYSIFALHWPLTLLCKLKVALRQSQQSLFFCPLLPFMHLKQAIISERVNVEFDFTLSIHEHWQIVVLESQSIGTGKGVKGVLI